MRKQTKLVAVASAAALLAIGASMTSFAATGWVEEDGQWYFYDKDGNRVEDTWKKSGENWYWLDGEEGGAMAVDKLIEDDEDTYYVDGNGVMVSNTWVKVVNEDQDDDEDPAEYNYYYMQSTGRAYKTSTGTTKFKTIDGKRYAFDEDGKMLYGWVNDSHERLASDSWEDGVYYLGNWDDGAMKTGWQKIYVEDENEDDDEVEHWFHFKSNGTKRKNDTQDDIKTVKINGKRYGFDNRGVMTYEWTVASKTTTNADASTNSEASSSAWRYFNDPEDGARVTKGWFKVVAPEEDNDNTFKNYGEGPNHTFAWDDANDENERWYYGDGNGKLAVGEIKKIKGKYYAFAPENSGRAASMLNGLVLMKAEGDKVIDVADDGVDADELSDILDGDYDDKLADGYTLFYFGNDEDNDGAMKTGSVNVNLDGESYSFLFSKAGGAEGKGRGLTGIDDNKYIYKAGCRVKAGSDDKYQIVTVEAKDAAKGVDINSKNAVVKKADSAALRTSTNVLFTNDDEESVAANNKFDATYYLVNTSGAIQKNKVAAKDGNDWYYYVEERAVKLYSNNKNLDDKAQAGTQDWKNWK